MAKGRIDKLYFARETKPSLPLELVTEILSWLPVLSLIVSKCVCKAWKSIIEEPSFIKKHMNRSSTMVLFQGDEDVDAKKRKFKVIRASEGLVLQEGDQHNYRIKNPATRQVLCLPDPLRNPGFMFFNYVSGSMVYKLIHLHFKGGGSTELCCEVLTVADELAWRGLNIPSVTNIYGGQARFSLCPISDTLYIIKLAEPELADSRVICLDLVTECSSCIEIPTRFFYYWKYVYPMMWHEKLSLTSVVEDKLILWVLESCKKKQWADRKIVIPLPFLRDLLVPGEDVRAFSHSGSILYLIVNNVVCISYDIEEKEAKQIWLAQKAFELHSSLVQLKGMQAEERIEG